ncbi:MAG TPA: hypothetical protein VJR89_21370 [Polyangiales bacterium]|nr:hypothetical protein [Polyangiales bacterium]
MQFKVFESGIENSGESVGAIVDGFKKFPTIAQKYMCKYGFLKPNQTLADLDRTRWYSEESWLQAFEAISNEVGLNSLYGVGKAMIENAVLPPQICDVPSALGSLDVAYHMNHRKKGVIMFDPQTGMMLEGIGHFVATVDAAEKRVVVVSNTPYPCDFERGIVGGFASRFDPNARTVHDSNAPCRKKGAESCTYVTWW